MENYSVPTLKNITNISLQLFLNEGKYIQFYSNLFKVKQNFVIDKIWIYGTLKISLDTVNLVDDLKSNKTRI